jgi:hypothetical protein
MVGLELGALKCTQVLFRSEIDTPEVQITQIRRASRQQQLWAFTHLCEHTKDRTFTNGFL